MALLMELQQKELEVKQTIDRVSKEIGRLHSEAARVKGEKSGKLSAKQKAVYDQVIKRQRFIMKAQDYFYEIGQLRNQLWFYPEDTTIVSKEEYEQLFDIARDSNEEFISEFITVTSFKVGSHEKFVISFDKTVDELKAEFGV